MTILDELLNVFGSRTKALEIAYLIYNNKPVVRQGFYDNELEKVKEFCKKNKLAIEISPYKIVLADKNLKYSNKGIKVKKEDPRKGMYFVYISKDAQKAALAETFEFKNDHRSLGLLLGYPECCVNFFIQNEPKRSQLDNDYVLPALNNSPGLRHVYWTNISKRHVDFTLLSHFPHAFNCEKSIAIAQRNFKLITELDPNLAMRMVKELKCKVSIGNKFVEFY